MHLMLSSSYNTLAKMQQGQFKEMYIQYIYKYMYILNLHTYIYETYV